MNKSIDETTLSSATKKALKDAGFRDTRGLAAHFFRHEGMFTHNIGEKREWEIKYYLIQEGWRCHPDGYERLYFEVFKKVEEDEIISLMNRPIETDVIFNLAMEDSAEWDQHQDLLKDHFGINCGVLTYATIGEKYNITPSRARKICSDFVHDLRRPHIKRELKTVTYSWLKLYSLYSSTQEENRRLKKANWKLKRGLEGDTRLKCSIDELKPSVRVYNCLKRAGINTIGDLIKKSPEELMELNNFGLATLNEVINKLKALGLELAE